MNTKHTPTPWVVRKMEKPNPYGALLIVAEGVGDVCRVFENHADEAEAAASAAFIVRACNAHEHLVDALMAALPFLEDIKDDLGYKSETVPKARAKVRAALAAAGVA